MSARRRAGGSGCPEECWCDGDPGDVAGNLETVLQDRRSPRPWRSDRFCALARCYLLSCLSLTGGIDRRRWCAASEAHIFARRRRRLCGSKTVTFSPQVTRCQQISSTPPASKRTVREPSVVGDGLGRVESKMSWHPVPRPHRSEAPLQSDSLETCRMNARHSAADRTPDRARMELPRFSGQMKTVGISTEVRDSQW